MPSTVSSSPGVLSVLDALGVSTVCTADHITLQCPFCEGSMHAVLDAFLCSSPHCPWLVGDVLDFTASVKGSPGEAVSWLLNEFPSQYEHIPALNRKTWIVHTLHARKQQRALIDMLVTKGGPSANLPIDAATLGKRLAAKGWSPEAVNLTSFSLSAVHMRELRALVEAVNPALARVMTDWGASAALVTPYGPSPAVISALHVNWPKTKTETTLWLDPYAQQYAGLWQRQLSDRPILTMSLTELYQLQTDTAVRRPDLRPLAWLGRPDQASASQGLHRPVLAVAPDHRPIDWQKALTYHPGLRFASLSDVCQGSPRVRTHDWASLVANYACEQAATGLSVLAQTHLRSLTLTSDERSQVRRAIQDAGYLEAVAIFDTLTTERVVTYTERGSIVETRDGYELRENSKPTEILCNFVMQPKASVVFGQDSRLSYEFEMTFADQDFRVLVSRNSLDNPQQVEEQVQSSVLRSDGRRTDQIPMILSKNNFRHITRYWKEHLARCQVKQGIETLGWSSDRKKFWTARGYVDIDGMHEFSNMQWHPDVTLFKSYSSERKPLSSPHRGALPGILQNLWRYTAAGLVRTYHNRVHNALALEQTPAAQFLLERLFSSLDQTQGLTPNMIHNTSDTLCGFPAYGFSQYDSLATRTPGNMFLLSPTGHQVPDLSGMEDLDWDALSSRYYQDMLRIALWLFGQTECAYESQPHVLALSVVLNEGNWVLQQIDSEEVWPTPAYPYATLEAYLATLAGDVSQHVRLQQNNRGMRLRMDATQNSQAFIELQALVGPAVIHIVDAEWVECDSSHLGPVLRQYFSRLDNIPTYS